MGVVSWETETGKEREDEGGVEGEAVLANLAVFGSGRREAHRDSDDLFTASLMRRCREGDAMGDT